MDTTELNQAVQQPNVTGALQQLLLSRANTPEQSQQVQQNRQSTLQQYQDSLRAPPTPEYSPSTAAAYNWIGNMGRMSPFAAVTSGIGAGGKMLGEMQAAKRQGYIDAAKAGYSDAAAQDVLDSRELSNLRGAAGRAGANGTTGAEKILPLYSKIFNSYSQQAKDMQFADPAERTAWIRGRTDEAVASAVSQFGGSVNPDVLARLHAMSSQSSQTSDVPSESLRAQPIGLSQRIQTPSDEISSTPPPGMLSLVFRGKTPEQVRQMAQQVRDPAQRAELLSALDGGQPILQDFPKAAGTTMSNADRAKFSQLTPQGAPPFANKPNEALMKSGASAMGGAYAKEYEDMAAAAAPAKEQLDAYNALEKIDPNTNAFANVQGYIGTVLQGLGVDPNAPIIQDAIKNRQATTLISQMSNAALRGEKGVQTRSDEVRIGNELARTTDPKQAWKFLIQLGKERANRRIGAAEFATTNANENNGVPIAPRVKFTQSVIDDPLTQEFGGHTIFRTPTIEAFMRKYPDADVAEAVDYWKGLEQSWKSRKTANQGAR